MDYKRVCVGLAVVFVRSNSAASEGTRKVLEIERVALFEMALVMCFWSTVEPFFFEIYLLLAKIKPKMQITNLSAVLAMQNMCWVLEIRASIENLRKDTCFYWLSLQT